MFWVALLLAVANAAQYTSFFDAECKFPITPSVVFTDVCTWTSNRYSGSYSTYLSSCSNSEFEVTVFNLTDSPSALCQGSPLLTIPVNTSCTPYLDFYVKGSDFTCESQNSTYNILGHFRSDCKDGGIPFSIQLGGGTCQERSFGPGFFNWDTQGGYTDPYYTMSLYNTTNGTCQNEITVYRTEQFPAYCLAPVGAFQSIFVDIYQAFPVNP